MVKITAKAITEPVPKGTYEAKIKSYNIDTRGEQNYEYVDFFWEILTGEHEGKEVRQGMPLNLSVKSNLGALIKELTGEEVVADEEYDLDDLNDKEATLTVTLEDASSEDAQGKKTKFEVNRVIAVIANE